MRAAGTSRTTRPEEVKPYGRYPLAKATDPPDPPFSAWRLGCSRQIRGSTHLRGDPRVDARLPTEGGRFDLPRRGLPACRFSRPVHSTALPPFHGYGERLMDQCARSEEHTSEL